MGTHSFRPSSYELDGIPVPNTLAPMSGSPEPPPVFLLDRLQVAPGPALSPEHRALIANRRPQGIRARNPGAFRLGTAKTVIEPHVDAV